MDWLERKADVLSELSVDDLEIMFEALVNLKMNNRDLEKKEKIESLGMVICLAKAKAKLKEQG